MTAYHTNPTRTLTLHFFSDPGHGWLSVKRAYLNELGIEHLITPYSYQRGASVYLEEDCDAPRFCAAAKDYGWEIKFKESYTDKRSPIRSYDHFRKAWA